MLAPSGRANGSEVIVIGAGPYGLAVAAHLRARGIAAHVFGEPMSFWRGAMPKGMKLRSPWGATDISDPAGALSLDVYVDRHGVAREEPFPLEAFVGYGSWFQANAVPDIDRRMVASVDIADGAFRVVANDGEAMTAKRIVVATGLAGQQFRPAAFARMPRTLVTHTSEHDDLAPFRGKRVAVIGRGQSACESAVLLSEAGAQAEIICRGPIHWLGTGKRPVGLRQEVRAGLSALLATPSGVGPFPLNWFVEVPNLLHLLPADARARFNAASLRAGAAGWLRPRFDGVGVTAGVEIIDAAANGDQVEVTTDRGAATFDHVLLATGYRIDIAKFGILPPALLAAIAQCEGYPVLSAGLESSVPGLHFVGATAVFSLGPLMRFIAGTGFAARKVARAVIAGGTFARTNHNKCLENDLAA
jgi:cation diffusion facilitator CzcD-associated flavoprotein CzcO